MADKQAALDAVMNLLEASPDSSPPDSPNQREKLALLVSTRKGKEAIGTQLSYDQVKHLSEEDVKNIANGMRPTQAAIPR